MKSKDSEGFFQLKRILYENSDVFDFHQWPSEDLRWMELIASLTLSINRRLEKTTIGDAIAYLFDMDLLDVKKLAQIDLSEREGNIQSLSSRISQIMTDFGFNKSEIKKTISVWQQMAANTLRKYDGKIQRFVRAYGQMMVDELTREFKIKGTSQIELRYAFTLWLQTVTDMPIPLDDENTRRFCKRFGLTLNDLTDSADELDINIALVDDLIRLSEKERP